METECPEGILYQSICIRDKTCLVFEQMPGGALPPAVSENLSHFAVFLVATLQVRCSIAARRNRSGTYENYHSWATVLLVFWRASDGGFFVRLFLDVETLT